ncbi:hypothetical protein GKZ89_11775 [Bacillus mangrovi]|uniref:Uncharacterized protein n=1 Tax=Metabacillus mangrovi TaxID=1491830 RepID=A0A7X2V5I4_9BACI|nr:hypothetical protein [Metabacillus mangrovi]MTH54088.1 hypothetical protein [Metabacillus mangrovi]
MKREYNSETIEIWNVMIEDTDSMNYLILADKKRPSTVQDYPWLRDEEKDLFEPTNNFIKVQFVSNKSLEDLHLSFEDLAELTENLLNHVAQAYCDWNIDYILNSNSKDLLGDLMKTHGINRSNSSTCRFLSQKSV